MMWKRGFIKRFEGAGKEVLQKSGIGPENNCFCGLGVGLIRKATHVSVKGMEKKKKKRIHHVSHHLQPQRSPRPEKEVRCAWPRTQMR